MTKHTDIIIISLWAHGFSVDVDGTQDGEIYCLKAGGVAADACETITMETAKLLSIVSEADDEDPFADIEDEDELEKSETVLDDCLEKLYATIHMYFNDYDIILCSCA